MPWLSPLGGRLTLALDPLAAPLTVFVAGLAAPILIYTSAYLPAREQPRLVALLLTFMASMVLLLLAQDLLVMFVALELTALLSFLLIRFHGEQEEARRASRVALMVTVSSSLLFVVGALWVAREHGTTSIRELRLLDDGAISPWATTCLALGVLAKSAQVPLHFWLPRAMVAPTPVSAYLHSATLVAAGVFTLRRLHFMIDDAPALLTGLEVVGFASIFVGGAFALVADEFKRLLAWSTIAQHGYAMVLVVHGGEQGLFGAALFLVAHGLCKCALFLTAGAVTETTGAKALSEIGGLWRRMPGLAVASGVAVAGLAGLPWTIGYFKDELFFAVTHESGTLLTGLAVAAGAMTFAYGARLWLGLFTGSARDAPRPVWGLSLPVVVLAVVVVAGGLLGTPLSRAFPGQVELGYHLRAETWMALAAWGLGVVLVSTRALWSSALARALDSAARLGSARAARAVARLAHAGSEYFHQRELRRLRDRLIAVVVPTAVLVVAGLVARGSRVESLGLVRVDDIPVVFALLFTGVCTLVAVRPARHVTLVLLLSFVGFGLALVFALGGAPDVALVVVVIETTITILFVALLGQLRAASLDGVLETSREQRQWPWPGLIAGAVAFMLSWTALDAPQEHSVSWAHVRLTEAAHAKDVVTAILADFRGLDTAGELTVLAVAIFGAGAITWRRRA